MYRDRERVEGKTTVIYERQNVIHFRQLLVVIAYGPAIDRLEDYDEVIKKYLYWIL